MEFFNPIYRSLIKLENKSTLEELMHEQIHSWLKSKSYEADKITLGRQVQVAESATAVLVEDSFERSGKTIRFRLSETHKDNWQSELTLVIPSHSSETAWLQMQVRNLDSSIKPAVPRLMTGLLEVLKENDSTSLLRPTPATLHIQDLDLLLEYICDEPRNEHLILAGTGDQYPQMEMERLVAKVTNGTIGVASTFVLDPELTSALMEELTSSHAVKPGAIRTYLPYADPAVEFEGRRHKTLSPETIFTSSENWIRKVLSDTSIKFAASQPLPVALQKAEKKLSSRIDEAILLGIPTFGQYTKSKEKDQAVNFKTDGKDLAKIEEEVALDTSLEKTEILREIAETDSRKTDSGTHLTYLEEIAFLKIEIAEANLLIEEYREKSQELKFALDSKLKEIERLELDEAIAYHDARTKDLENQRLWRELNRAGLAVNVMNISESVTEPKSIKEILDYMSNLSHVVFVGDKELAIELDEYDDFGTFAERTWAAVNTLEDYAKARDLGIVNGGIHAYLTKTPQGYQSWPANKHAANESDSTKNQKKFLKQRIFKFEDRYGIHREEFMESHFKIAQSGSVSPRLHYLDDKSTNCIYIGYIGRHLDNPSTN